MPPNPQRQTDTPVFDHLRAGSMLAAIEAVSSRHAGDELMTTELARMEKNILKRRKIEIPSEFER